MIDQELNKQEINIRNLQQERSRQKKNKDNSILSSNDLKDLVEDTNRIINQNLENSRINSSVINTEEERKRKVKKWDTTNNN